MTDTRKLGILSVILGAAVIVQAGLLIHMTTDDRTVRSPTPAVSYQTGRPFVLPGLPKPDSAPISAELPPGWDVASFLHGDFTVLRTEMVDRFDQIDRRLELLRAEMVATESARRAGLP